MKVKLSSIHNTEPQRDNGNIEGLKESIASIGLINPLTIDENMNLMAGRRRYQSLYELYGNEYEVEVYQLSVDGDRLKAFRISIDENLKRKPLTNPEIASAIKEYDELKRKLEGSRPAGNPNLPHRGELGSWTQEKTAQDLGISSTAVGKAIQVATAIEKHPDWANETGVRILHKISEQRLEDKFAKKREPKEKSNLDWLRVYNIWNFQPDITLGERHPGNIPGQIALNILYYYTNEGDLVVDPMAGGGSTIDACKQLNRKCLAYDIDIKRDDIIYNIIYNDIRQGFPSEAKDCQLIFLDPPYYKIMRDKYVEASVSSLDLQGFLDFLSELAINCYKTVRQGGFVSFLCQNYYSKFASLDDGYINFGIESHRRFIDAGFTLVNEINCPQTSQVYSASDVELAKKQKGMLNLVRDLMVYRK